jgi:hypothetical protein
MILKGNQRGGGQQLAAHLMNSFDNERVEVADVRGAVAQDLSGAFAEWSAQARATRCRKNLYSLSLNPDQAQGHLNRKQYLELLDRTERSLKLVGQPRAVVFHEKRDKDGNLREHCHAVWSRIDTDRMKAVQISHDRLKLRTVARDFARDHGLKLPDGMKPGRSKGSRRDRFNASANLAEKQQQERTGISIEEHVAEITACWRKTGNGAAFVEALKAKGYVLARGDRRAYVVIDLSGEVHSLARRIEGVRTKELKERLSEFSLEKLPDVETAKAWAKKEREERQKQQIKEPSEAEKRRDALKAHQQQRRSKLDQKHTDLVGRHKSEREGLEVAQQAQNAGITDARLQSQPRGFVAFLTRVTGIKLVAGAWQKLQDKARAAEHKKQTKALRRTHDRELYDIDRRYVALSRIEARENLSAELAVKRERFHLLVLKKPPARVLKTEFDRVANRLYRQRTGTEDGKSLKDSFGKAADIGLRKGELQAAFERATSGKTKPAGDAGEGGPAPANPEKTDQAHDALDEFRKRQPRPGPDRDREK